MKTHSKEHDAEKEYGFLLDEYRSLSSTITLEILIFRIMAFAWVIFLIWIERNQVTQILLISVSAVFTGILSANTRKAREQAKTRLEQAILELSMEYGNNNLEKVYVNSRYIDMKRRRLMQLVSLEPLLWILITVVIATIRILTR